jgi:hypothetical protein
MIRKPASAVLSVTDSVPVINARVLLFAEPFPDQVENCLQGILFVFSFKYQAQFTALGCCQQHQRQYAFAINGLFSVSELDTTLEGGRGSNQFCCCPGV